MLGINSADCEDYAISKYFTLISMGVDEANLRITYVKALELNEAHMVLAYYASPSSTPPILIAASVTVAMIITLKNTPRNRARKPHRKAARRPEYRSS